MQLSTSTNQPGCARERLVSAFLEFERASDTLNRSYQALERRVAQLDSELARARRGEQAERATAGQLAARLSRLLEVLPAGVVVLDGDGRIRECNPAAEELLGSGATPGAGWRELAAAVFRPTPGDGPDLGLRDGRRVHLATCSLGDEPGQLLLLTDVTGTRALQDRIERLRRLSQLGDVAATLAHQIRTPLSSALLDAAAARGRLQRVESADAARARDSLGRITATLGRLERLVGDLLAFARRGEFTVERFSLADALLAQFAMPAAGGPAVAVQATGSTAVTGSREALLSVIGNLVANAGEAGASRVEIACRADADGALEVRVTDDGPGIAGAIRDRVFEPFVTTREAGTGLGLAIARGVIETHGGRIEAVDGGHGACFLITLPASSVAAGDIEGGE